MSRIYWDTMLFVYWVEDHPAETADRYARIRAAERVSLADAIHLASAAESGVDLFLTNDHRLQRLAIPGLALEILRRGCRGIPTRLGGLATWREYLVLGIVYRFQQAPAEGRVNAESGIHDLFGDGVLGHHTLLVSPRRQDAKNAMTDPGLVDSTGRLDR